MTTTASRTCHRPGCGWPAAATLSYRYATRQVWLCDLSAAPDPSLHDLCPEHADTLTVPRGWAHVDERTAAPARRLPDKGVVVTGQDDRPAPTVGASHQTERLDRYEALRDDLPRVAAQLAQAGWSSSR